MISLGGVVLKNGGSFTFLDSTMFNVPTAPVVKPAPVKPIVKPVRPAVKPVRPLSKPAPSQLVAKPSLLQPLLKPVPMKLVIKLLPLKPVQVQPAPTKPALKIVKITSVPLEVPSKTLSKYPSKNPSRIPSKKPSNRPSTRPTKKPSAQPIVVSTTAPSDFLSDQQT
jgi:hypothetical protein